MSIKKLKWLLMMMFEVVTFKRCTNNLSEAHGQKGQRKCMPVCKEEITVV